MLYLLRTFGSNGYRHIRGAYCLPEHRGKGLYQNLLNYTISKLKSEGYTRLGVNFESFNPTARGFWLKYFAPYTSSVVRRIDERIIQRILQIIGMTVGAKTVPRNHANKNRTAKTNENMQISVIKSIENTSKNAIHIA